jgi:hypothetical protein
VAVSLVLVWWARAELVGNHLLFQSVSRDQKSVENRSRGIENPGNEGVAFALLPFSFSFDATGPLSVTLAVALILCNLQHLLQLWSFPLL